VDPSHPIHRSAQIIGTLLALVATFRSMVFAASALLGLAAIATHGLVAALLATASFAAAALGQFVDRYLYFSAVVAPKMPGAVTTS
jgi:hypothetical protein